MNIINEVMKKKFRGRQLSISGNVVNVFVDVMLIVNKFLRMLIEDKIILLKLKCSLNFKYFVVFERIRFNKVLNVVEWFVENSELFRNKGL